MFTVSKHHVVQEDCIEAFLQLQDPSLDEMLATDENLRKTLLKLSRLKEYLRVCVCLQPRFKLDFEPEFDQTFRCTRFFARLPCGDQGVRISKQGNVCTSNVSAYPDRGNLEDATAKSRGKHHETLQFIVAAPKRRSIIS